MVRNNWIRAQIRVLILTLFIGVLGGRALGQVFNVYEGYNQGLENGWQNWSNFGGVNLQSGPALVNTYSCQITYTGSGQIAQFEFPNGFTSAYIAAIGLYLYEPTTSGRTVNVSINANGVQSATVSLTNYIIGTQAANTWMEVVIPLTAFGITQTSPKTIYNVEFTNGVTGAQAPFNFGVLDWVAWPAALLPPIAIDVNPSSQLQAPLGPRVVDQKMSGVNTAMWDSGFSGPICQDLIGGANFRAFRFPGGSLSDSYDWSTNLTFGGTYNWPTNFDAFASSPLVRNAGGQDFITVDYCYGDVIHPGLTGPQLAANWVAHSKAHNYGCKYWEIGNEVYGTWEIDAHGSDGGPPGLPNDPITYANEFAQYWTAMKAVDPTIKIGAVITPGEDSFVNYPSESVMNPVTHASHSGWSAVMLSTLHGLDITPDFVIYHRYPEYNVDCDYTLLTGTATTPSWASDINGSIAQGGIRAMLNDYLDAGGTANVQIMCTENNADAGTPGKQLTSLTNALYLADSFGQALSTTELNSYLFWDLMNGQDTNPNDGPWLYGWRNYGDEGVFSPDFTQIYPTFFAEELVNLFALAGDQVVSCSSSYGMLTAYATKRADGTVRVMVINKARNQSFSAYLSFLGGFHPQGTAVEYQYGETQDTEQEEGWWPTVSTTDHTGTGILNNYYTFPPYSISVILYTPQGQVIPHPPLYRQPKAPIKP